MTKTVADQSKPSDALAIPVARHELSKSKIPAGLENVEADDLILPRLLTMQGQSKLVLDRSKKKNVGDFVNSLTEQTYEDVVFIPVVYSRYFNVYRYEGTGDRQQQVFEFRTEDKNDERFADKRWFRDGDDKAEIQTVRSFIGLVDGQPIVISFKSPSDLDGGKKLLTYAKLANSALFAHKYRITSKLKPFKKTSVYVKEVEPAGDVTPEEYALAEQIQKSFGSKTAIVAEEAAD